MEIVFSAHEDSNYGACYFCVSEHPYTKPLQKWGARLKYAKSYILS